MDELVARDRSADMLDTLDRVRWADDGGDVQLPDIVEPLVGPAPEHDEPALLRVVAPGGRGRPK